MTGTGSDARLVAFFEARLAEEEASAGDKHDRHDCDLGALQLYGDCSCGYPARVLAEIRIKRYLISEYRSVEGFDERAAVEAAMRLPDEQAAMTALGEAWAKEAARSLLLAVIKGEASLYALHPDYEAAWSLWPHVREAGARWPMVAGPTAERGTA